MKILVVSQNFYPDNFKINEVVQELVENQHEVTVLTGLGDYSTGLIPQRYRKWQHRNEDYHGASIHRVRTISRRTGPIFRSLNYLSFALNGWFWGKFQKKAYDVVYVYMPSPVTMGFPGIAVAKKQQIPLMIYNLDLWPESVKAMHIKEGTLPYRLIHRLSRHVYQQADAIAVSSMPFMDYLQTVNQIPKQVMTFIPQYATPSQEAPKLPELQAQIERHRAQFNLVFTGNIGLVQDLETIVQAVARLKERLTPAQLKIHLVGDGSNLDSIKNLVNRLNITDFVVFYGRQPETAMAMFYEFADACLLTLKNDNQIGVTIPAKLQGYMAAGKAVIAAIDGDAQRVITEADCGLRVSSGDIAGLADAIVQFMALPQETRTQFGVNGYTYYQQYFTKQQFMQTTEAWLTSGLGKGAI